MKQLLVVAILLCHGLTVNAMELSQEYNTHLVVIPGQNGEGGQNVTSTLSYFADKKTYTHNVATPNIIRDFGQNRCQSYLKKTLNSLDSNAKVIIHASSQGTATALNYVLKYPEKIKALILEAPMISGNSVIFHTVSYNTLPILNYIPGSYYALPYLAKLWPLYWFYSPAGEQALLNLDKLPENLPIIILHHEKDPQISHRDAQALYAALKSTHKNNNVYLMLKNSSWAEHVLLLSHLGDGDNVHKIKAINKILTKNNLLPEINFDELPQIKNNSINPSNDEINSTYQPKPKQKWLNHFENLHTKEKKIWYIDWLAKPFYGIIIYLQIKLFIKILQCVHLAL